MRRRFGWTVLLLAAAVLAAPAVALGTTATQPTLAVNATQLWTLLLGSLTPAVGYVLNKYAPWVSEPVKAGVQVALAAAAGAIYAAIAVHSFGFNVGSLELVGSAVLSALVAHKILWIPSGVAALLGSGQNAPRARARPRR